MKHYPSRNLSWAVLALVVLILVPRTVAAAPAAKRNVVFFLVDDMRHDAMSCMGHPFLETPAIDALAAGGVHFRNAFVTTSLCSPSRATFLTGLYAHKHKILDNSTLMDPAIPTFPRLLHEAGYKTGFVGKWHMGGSTDAPRPGFDYWASFRGQGNYDKNRFNINGKALDLDEYVTDAITRLSMEFLRENHESPFMLYMSHKAVHGPFAAADRHKGRYAKFRTELPPSGEDTPENYYRRPRWVHAQRDSWHGVNDMYHKRSDQQSTLDNLVRDYCETMLAVDDSIATLVKTLKELGLYDSTLIIFAGDNGFLFGEHGLIDKRCMYEESIRIPWIVSCPELYGTEGRVVEKMVLNVDLAPTILDAVGVAIPESMQGQSFLRLPIDPDLPWRTAFLYTYFWEAVFPETPTCFGVRTDQYKYVEYHGIWDTNELYDLKADPNELHNRISTSHRKKVTPDPEFAEVYQDLRKQLGQLKAEGGIRTEPEWGR